MKILAIKSSGERTGMSLMLNDELIRSQWIMTERIDQIGTCF